MKERILKIRKDNKLTQDAFAEKLNLSKNFVWMLEKGERVPSDRTISDICRIFGISEDWLRNGALPMKSYSDIDDYSEISTLIGETDPKAKRAIMDYWMLSDDDKKLFWAFVDKFILKKGE